MVMKDISRFQHRRRLGYAAVRLQQARPLVDADPNEELRLLAGEQTTLLQHLVGPKASLERAFVLGQPFVARQYVTQTPELRKNSQRQVEAIRFNGGDAISFPAFTIRSGKLLLGGQPLVLEQAEHIAFQRDFLQMKPSDLALDSNRTLYALQCWEQVVTSREDEELREPMLKSASNSVRIRRMRRVVAYRNVDPIYQTCSDFIEYLNVENSLAELDPDTAELRSKARLRVGFVDTTLRGRCAPEGTENLTLRVMLTAANHFVWSVEQPQIFRVKVTGLADPNGSLEIEMLDRPTNEAEVPLVGRVIELIPFGALLAGGRLSEREHHEFSRKIAAELGAFTRVTQGYDEDTRRFTVDRSCQRTGGSRFETAVGEFVRQWDTDHPEAAALNVDQLDNEGFFYLRMWHDAPSNADVELSALSPVTLNEFGLTLTLTAGLPGDHWYVSLRWSNPGVTEHEFLSAAGAAPHGPKRFLTPLALIDTTLNQDLVVDCMPRLERTTGDSCVNYTVGDGVTSFGDFTSIQAAIDALPSQGGKITVLPGYYADELRIIRRRNLVISGCGDRTVLETRQSSPGYGLCDIVSSENITFEGFRLNSVEQYALRLRNCMEVKLRDLTVVAGIHDANGLFIEGAWSTHLPLIDCIRSAVVDATELTLIGSQRPGLRCFNSELVELSHCRFTGLSGKDPYPAQVKVGATQPLVTISGSSLVRMTKSHVKAFGQVGLAVRSGSQDVTVTQCHFTGDEHHLTTGEIIGETRSCVDVESAERFTLERSTLTLSTTVSDHAALVLKGSDLAVRHNRVTALLKNNRAGAWGGIQVRGGCERVELRYNQIRGGVGHGITLGSVIWRPTSSPSPYSSPITHRSPAAGGLRREGAGQAQTRLIAKLDGEGPVNSYVVDLDLGNGFSDEGGLDYLPVPEGAIFDLVITDNRIDRMHTSGISVLTVMGLRRHGSELFEIERARIENNVINNNLSYLGNTLPTVVSEQLPFPAALAGTGLRLPVLPLGGIILSSASAIDIRNNNIYDNALSEAKLPISGIFVLTGDSINITGNQVKNNGLIAENNELAPGVRAGIAVMLAGTGPIDDLDELSPVLEGRVLLDSEGSSLRILNNNVVQPSGRALHVVATGPVTIQGNYLSSQSAQGSATPEDLFAVGDVVFVQNLGMPWEAFDIDALLLDRPRGQRSKNWLGTKDLTAAQLDALSPTGHVDSPLHGTEQFFTHYGTPPKLASYLRNSSLSNPRMFVGEGGRISFTDNQVVFDWDSPYPRSPKTKQAAPLSYFAVALVGLDHVAVTGNQFGMRLGPVSDTPAWTPPIKSETEPALAQVMVIGATLDVSRNRIASSVEDVSASLITFAEALSVVSLNQTTRSIYTNTAVDTFAEVNINVDSAIYPKNKIDALAAPPASSLSREFGNQVLYEEADHLRSAMKNTLTFCSQKLLQLPEASDTDIEYLL